MRPSVHRATRPIARRRLLLATPAALLPLVRASTAEEVLGPVAESAAHLRARVAAAAGDLHYAVSSPSRELFGRTLRRVLGDDAGVVAVSVLDRRTDARWHHRGEVPVPLASSAKILVVAAAMLRARDQGRALTDQEHDQARLAITQSDNEATDALYLRSGGHDAVAALAGQQRRRRPGRWA